MESALGSLSGRAEWHRAKPRGRSWLRLSSPKRSARCLRQHSSCLSDMLEDSFQRTGLFSFRISPMMLLLQKQYWSSSIRCPVPQTRTFAFVYISFILGVIPGLWRWKEELFVINNFFTIVCPTFIFINISCFVSLTNQHVSHYNAIFT